MRILLLVLSLLTASYSSIAEEAEIKVTDTPLVTSEREGGASEDSRLSACESNVQNLIGRVEVLEHLVKELQGTSTNVQGLVPGAVADGQVSVPAPVPNVGVSAEKRDYDLALSALKESKFVEASNAFLAFIQKYPNSELAGNAYFWYADSFYRRGEFDKAAVHYLKGYKLYPKSPKAGDNLLKLALALGELKKYKDACAMLNKLEAEYKNRPASSMKRAHDAKLKYCK